jgi:hypothetical protein
MPIQITRIVAAALAVHAACFDPEVGAGDASNEVADTTDTDGATTHASTSDPDSTTQSSTPTDPDTSAAASAETDPDATSSSVDPDSTTRSDDADESTTAVDSGVTIYQIQQGEVPVDTVVDVSDAICTAVGPNGFFMQDPAGGEWSGIWVFTGIGARLPALGDVLAVTGTYEEFNELSEINVADGSVTILERPGEGNVPVPEPIDLTDLGEGWESVLLLVSDASILVAELHPMPAVHEFRVEPSGGGTVWVDDLIYDATAGDFASFGIDATFTAIQGPLNYSFSSFKIAPRSLADFSGYAPP